MIRNPDFKASWAAVGARCSFVVCVAASCGPSATYSRLAVGSAGGSSAVGSGGIGPGGAGTGGTVAGGGTGGAGTGGAGSSGGAGTGGMLGGGTGGAGTGGMASGGTGTGGMGSGGRAGRGGATGTGGAGAGTGGAAGGGIGSGGAAGPRILSVNFVGGVPVAAGGAGGTSLIPMPMAPAEIAGVKAVANWNNAPMAMGNLPALVLSDGTGTAASLSWNVPPVTGSVGIYGVGLADAPGNARMMNGYLDPTDVGMPATIAVSGLPSAITTGGYDVYVYALGHLASGTRTYNYAIGATTFTVSQTGPSPTTVPTFTLAPNTNPGVGNYVIFRNITGASFTLTATPGTGTPRAPVNAIQIVAPTGS